MVDRYMRVVLTVIAAALVWLCLWGPGPKWGTPAQAQETARSPGPRYEMTPVLLTDKRGNFAGSDRYLVDTWEGRVWVWPNRAEPRFVPVPVQGMTPPTGDSGTK